MCARQVTEMLLATNLYSHRTSRPNAITAWYERRVQLGMALIGHPDVLVLDEPTRCVFIQTRLDLHARALDVLHLNGITRARHAARVQQLRPDATPRALGDDPAEAAGTRRAHDYAAPRRGRLRRRCARPLAFRDTLHTVLACTRIRISASSPSRTDTNAFLSGGRVWCVGSSEWLRTRFGLGYTLTCAELTLKHEGSCERAFMF